MKTEPTTNNTFLCTGEYLGRKFIAEAATREAASREGIAAIAHIIDTRLIEATQPLTAARLVQA